MIQKTQTAEQKQEGDFFAKDALKRKRKEMGLSIAQVSEKLCIRERYLTALEEKNYKIFPAMTYTYGFLRTYAEFLGLDADALVRQVKEETLGLSQKEDRAVYSLPEKQNLFPSFSALSVAVLLLAFAYVLWHVFFTPYEYENDEQLSSSFALEETIPAESQEKEDLKESSETENPDTSFDASSEKTASQEATADKTEKKPASVSERAIQPPVVPELDSIKAASEKKTRRVDERKNPLKSGAVSQKTEHKVYGSTQEDARVWLVANDETWVEIIDVDTVVLSRVLKKGDRYYAPVSDDLLMKTGNAGGLDIYIDGALYPPLGKKGAVYSGVSLSPEALKKRLAKNKVD
jgi:cytoskeleton protein RodZ